jgi:hypothetical protein
MKEIRKTVKGLDPIADAFAATVYTDIVSMRNYKSALFTIYKAVGATGTSTVTVQASDDVSASNVDAVPFHYQAITSGDTPGAVTAATTAGFATTAGSSQLYKIYVDASVLADSGYGFVRLKMVEVVDSPILGGVLIDLYDSADEREVPATAIV